jgi:hypothetical protein
MKWKMSIQQYWHEVSYVWTPWQRASLWFRSRTLWLSIWLTMRRMRSRSDKGTDHG